VMWCDVMWCDVMWCGVMWCDVMWCDVMWCDVMWCDVMWCDVMWCGVMWCGVMWCDVMWCDVMWCDVMWLFYVSILNPTKITLTVTIMLFYSADTRAHESTHFMLGIVLNHFSILFACCWRINMGGNIVWSNLVININIIIFINWNDIGKYHPSPNSISHGTPPASVKRARGKNRRAASTSSEFKLWLLSESFRNPSQPLYILTTQVLFYVHWQIGVKQIHALTHIDTRTTHAHAHTQTDRQTLRQTDTHSHKHAPSLSLFSGPPLLFIIQSATYTESEREI